MKINFVTLFLFASAICFAQFIPLDYTCEDNWAAHPMKGADDVDFNPSYTIISADTTQKTVVNLEYNVDSDYDVFCVYPTYPTVDLATNVVVDDSHRANADMFIHNMFSQFSRLGRIFAPYYQQVTLTTFSLVWPFEELQADLMENALTDVMDAFEYYMENDNNGKEVILAGHSQGSMLLGMMLRKFESDPQYSEYLDKIKISVLPGFESGPFVEIDEQTGGWWETIPVTQLPQDLNGVMSWGTHLYGLAPNSVFFACWIGWNEAFVERGMLYDTFEDGVHEVKMDPLGFENGKSVECAIFPNGGSFFDLGYPEIKYDIYTEFYAYSDLYHGSIEIPNEQSYGLVISQNDIPNDMRPDPVDSAITLGWSDLHVLDMFVAMGDVINLLECKLGLVSAEHDVTMCDYQISNFPNPFNPITKISFNLPNDSEVKIAIFNIKGQKVKTLVNEQLPAGKHSVTWNGIDQNNSQVGSGVYFYNLQTKDFNSTKKMILIK